MERSSLARKRHGVIAAVAADGSPGIDRLHQPDPPIIGPRRHRVNSQPRDRLLQNLICLILGTPLQCPTCALGKDGPTAERAQVHLQPKELSCRRDVGQ